MDDGSTTTGDQDWGSRWARYEAAELGFRHYWYPVLESRRLRKRPRAVTLLGEKIVLVRTSGRVHALKDRCPHRGVPLSMGRSEFPGMITCAYHGWTFDAASGELVAALTDGPDSPICGRPEVSVPTYPVEERAGLIWVYMGEEPRPPVEEDIPEGLLRDDAVVEPMVELRPGNWRDAMENAVDESHAKYLHRRTPYYLFSRIPGYQTDTRMVPDEDGKTLRRVSTPVFEPAEYPRIGAWPPRQSWKRAARAKPGAAPAYPNRFWARLPAIFYINHDDWHDYQMFVPADAGRHLALQVSVCWTGGLGAWLWRLRYWTYIRFIHHIVLNRWEDGPIVAAMDSPPEQLFRPDTAIVAWRRWCHENARRGPAERSAAGDTGAGKS
jgi:phenylpropionate dioxygenase-like ring-hydroxylating dioxygenase large terminal subunit